MAKKGKIHNIRDIFTNRNFLEGATFSQSSEGDTFKVEGFTLIKAGLSSNGNFYSAATLRKAAEKGVFNEKTIRTDHPEMTRKQSVNDIVGKIEKTWFNEETESLKGSGFFSSTADDLVTKVKEGLVGDLSINARGITKIEKSGDKLRRDVKEITQGFSVDLVCEAAAGGSLHEDYQKNKELCERMKKRMEDYEKLTYDELAEARPDLIEKVLKEAGKSIPKKTEKSEEVQALGAEETKILVAEAVGTAVNGILEKRDKAAAKKADEDLLSEGIQEAIAEVLTECAAPDSVKVLVGKSLTPFGAKKFAALADIDKKVLSEERDKIMADFEALIKEHANFVPPKDGAETGSGEKTGTRLLDLVA